MVGRFDGVIFISFIDTPNSPYSELDGAPNHGSGIGGLNIYMKLEAKTQNISIKVVTVK